MVAHIVDQFSFQDYTVLILDRDIPMRPYNVYKIYGVTYKPAPFHARPLTDKIIMNVIAIQATGDFISKKVIFTLQ